MTAAVAGVAAVGLDASGCIPPPKDNSMTHLAWAWHFGADGPPDQMASVLAQNNLGLILKCINGCDWMSKWDKSTYAISGPSAVSRMSDYFEKAGIPFHMYAVLQGIDPAREAAMCADVISAGARSIFLDVEPWAGYYSGNSQSATIFGQEFRRLQPNGTLYLCVEPRPWVSPRIPMYEFSQISQGIAPMVYWDTFNTSDNVTEYTKAGYPPGPDGITPEFVLDVTYSMFAGYGLPIYPVGQGASTLDNWVRFLTRVAQLKMGAVSVWRYGVANTQIWPLLKANPPGTPEVSVPSIPTPTRTAKRTKTPTPRPKLKVGDEVKVVNTGSCLNVHTSASVSTGTVQCVDDGKKMTIIDGPIDADGYRWWQVDTGTKTGWAAEYDAYGNVWLVAS